MSVSVPGTWYVVLVGVVNCSDHPDLPPHLHERPYRFIQVIPGMWCGNLAADPRLTLRHHGVSEAGHEHALGQQHVAHPDRGRRLADDDRDDRRLPRQRLDSRLDDPLAEVARVVAELLHAFGMLLDELHGSQRAGG